MEAPNYDIIIVGGRPAGATLAARLGLQDMRVLLLERATFPSAPAASCPVIYPATMRLLDEIGADEGEYARGTPRVRRLVTEVRDDLRATIRIPELCGRDYVYAIDRARFDAALWQTAARCPTVTARTGFAVTDLLWEGDRVVGVRGRPAGGADEQLTAGCVVGADGRFSLVARKAGAAAHDERSDLPTSIYYAYWKNAAPYDGAGPSVQTYGEGRGYGIGLLDSADGTVCAAIQGRADALEPGDRKPADLYLRLLRAHPRIWRRLGQAEMVTEVRGMRNVGNLYRQAGGPGWALVGDALHQKDPIDGQGIYDAVYTAKALALALLAWRRGAVSWERAIESYEATVRAATYPMYVETLDRVRRELYTPRPDWAYRTWVRWLSTDPEYQRRLGLLLGRGVDPAHWLPPAVFWRALGRGALADLGRLFARHPRRDGMKPVSVGVSD